MNELQIFRNDQFGEIRTVEIGGEPWFVGKDIADKLGYSASRNAIAAHVDEEDKLTHQISAAGQMRDVIIINESGLYSLVLSSKLPTAKQFKRWITSEVIPSIRKHGAYMSPDTLENMITNPEFGIKLLSALKEERTRRAELESKVEADAPKVLFASAVETAKTSILVGDLAKILRQNGVDIGQNRLFQWMRDNGYLIKEHRQDYNSPTQKAMDMGLFEVKEGTVLNPNGSVRVTKTTKVTGKGQVYFINLFLDRGEDQ